MAGQKTLTQLVLDPILLSAPAQPRITYYDDAVGGRVELSALTLANWAAKSANFIRDEVGLTPGDPVTVALPPHWQTLGILLGCWWAGCEVNLDLASGAARGAELVFTTSDLIDEADATDPAELVIVGVDPMGMGVRNLAPGLIDYASSVRVHGDRFSPSYAGPAFPDRSVESVVTQATLIAKDRGWSASGRILSNAPWSTPDQVVSNVLAVLTCGASLVQVANSADPTKHQAAERVTHNIS